LKINVHSYITESKANGPGKRFVIWFQGCSIRCLGCFNKKTWRFDIGDNYYVKDLVKIFCRYKSKNNLDGVAISGGEPFDQLDGLLDLTQKLKYQKENILCYTGYTYNSLKKSNDSRVTKILDNIDILIDGKFDESQRSDLQWRGSKNQQIYYLNNISKKNCQINIYDTDVEYFFDNHSNIIITGFPKG